MLTGIVDEAYIHCDKMIGRILETLDDNTTVIIVSDHGFVFTGLEHWHAPPGTFIAYGKNILPIGEVRGINVYDITPTILYLAGLPVGKDMEGKPVTQVIDPRFVEKYPVEYVETYNTDPSETTGPKESILDDEIIERYKTLGYIQ
jgi:arylsulfatase A-like enzyme